MDWIDLFLIPFIKSAIIAVGLTVAFAMTVFMERRVAARFQLRIGPNRAGPWGVLTPMADAFKALFKESFIPDHVDKPVYLIAPVLSAATALFAFGVVPIAPSFELFGRTIGALVADVDIGILYILAVTTVGLYGVIFAGWASHGNFTLIGSLKAAAQLISYEIPMTLALASVVLVVGSLRLTKIVEFQRGLPLLVLQPVAALIYFITIMNETNRFPFDMPETESELVTGFSIEYGDMKFAIFFMAEYINMITAAAIFSTLFLGGWQGPFLPPVLWFFIKTYFVIFVFMWIRASVARVRYDKLMRFNWTFLIPLAALNLMVTAIAVILLT